MFWKVASGGHLTGVWRNVLKSYFRRNVSKSGVRRNISKSSARRNFPIFEMLRLAQCFEITRQAQCFKIRRQAQHFKIFRQTQFSVTMRQTCIMSGIMYKPLYLSVQGGRWPKRATKPSRRLQESQESQEVSKTITFLTSVFQIIITHFKVPHCISSMYKCTVTLVQAHKALSKVFSSLNQTQSTSFN